MSSVTSQVKVPSSSQCRRNEALGFSTARRDLNPATPATSTEVSITPLGCFPRRPNRNLRQLLLLSPEAPNRLLDLGLRHTRQFLRRRLQTACELTPPSWPLSSPRQVLIHGGPWKLLVQFFCEFSEGNTNLDWLSASRGQGSQRDVSKSRHVLVLEAGKCPCEEGEHLSRCTERFLQIQSNLRLQKKSIVEPVEAVAAGWTQNFELHKVLQIFWGDAQNCARLL